MSTLSLRIPESLHNRVKRLASEDKISINQFIASALAEKISALETSRYLEERAHKGDLEKFRKVLSKVPDVEPEFFDKIE
ncbi:toxin-antitoxin system HicB family antitoxin [candidate division KSB1 bacterium]|nr:toxin-antitoxin system HicB family antitoxin [candidate division KSB1 bacterium]